MADPIKASTRAAVQELKAEGIRVVMVTGDHRDTAEAVARQLGIEEVMAERFAGPKGTDNCPSPSRKAVWWRWPATALMMPRPLHWPMSGIAMGTGADTAIESAGITLVKGDLRGLLRARRLSQATMRNIRQNLFFAFLYNVVGVPIAAGVLYPVWGVLLSPMIASAAMTFSSVSVISNALRLRHMEL